MAVDTHETITFVLAALAKQRVDAQDELVQRLIQVDTLTDRIDVLLLRLADCR